MSNITTKLVNEPRGRRPGVYLVYHGASVIGGLERHRETRTTSHPYRAYGIKNFDDRTLTRFLGAFYDRDGGKDAAIQAVISHYNTFTN